VVPDGALSTVPFESFRVAGSSGLLIERCEVSYLPSARFLKSKSPARWRAPWATEIVTLADPLVSHDPLEEQWAPLPESASEARGIAEVLAGRTESHLGADMRKSYLTALAPRGVPLIHLATHAAIDAENPDRSRILFSNDYLLQEEVYDLNLAGVDLVTLSACDTARGRFVRGEGVQAFGQAFLAAGAASVVTTLWRVADGPTADFMKQFYYALSHGAPKGEALRQAKLRFLHSHTALSDSRYWAAFILTGESGSPIPRAVPWSACLFAVAVFLASAMVAGRLMAGRWTRQKL
jgi:CHAT domain-containing protein